MIKLTTNFAIDKHDSLNWVSLKRHEIKKGKHAGKISWQRIFYHACIEDAIKQIVRELAEDNLPESCTVVEYLELIDRAYKKVAVNLTKGKDHE